MSRSRILFVVAVVMLAGGLAVQAAAQVACTAANDPACNHLKCYQIKGPAITVPLQVDNQFGRESFATLQPALLCLPSQKSCCNTAGVCSAANCNANPPGVVAPGLPHFKCYKMKKAFTCTDLACTQTTKFPKGKLVNLTTQFGVETNVRVGKPVLFCAPALKEVVGQTTTTTTTSQTTTTTIVCRDTANPGQAAMCAGDCPAPLACVFVSAVGCTCETPCALQQTTCNMQFCPNQTQHCQPSALNPCGCCGLPNAPCTQPADCCSGTCITASGMCQ